MRGGTEPCAYCTALEGREEGGRDRKRGWREKREGRREGEGERGRRGEKGLSRITLRVYCNKFLSGFQLLFTVSFSGYSFLCPDIIT